VSHLEEQISALIDGELTGADLDRANAHLAACERCRGEAAALRQLKRQLRALASPFDLTVGADSVAAAVDAAAGQRAATADEALTRRLLAMAGPGGPVPSRRFRREQFRRARHEQHAQRQGGTRGGAGGGGGPPPGSRPRSGWPSDDGRPPRVLRVRGRYVIWSVVSLAVVGIGAAAFSMGGGGGPQPGPKVTPQLEMFSLEHAAQTGGIPIPELTQAPTARP
jgi:anti-sigma factor RsiW